MWNVNLSEPVPSTQRTRKSSKGRTDRRERMQSEEAKWAFDKQIHRTVIIRRSNEAAQLGG